MVSFRKIHEMAGKEQLSFFIMGDNYEYKIHTEFCSELPAA